MSAFAENASAGPETDAIARARDGDSEAFRVLVERHSRGVYRVAYRITGDRDDAEDVVQETFLKAFRQLDRFEERASFSTWVHRIATNCALDLLRSRARETQPQEDEALEHLAVVAAATSGRQPLSPERLASSGEVAERVREGLALLSPLERTAFVLRHFEGEPIERIAGVLGIKDNAAKHCVFRAVRKMRRVLSPFSE